MSEISSGKEYLFKECHSLFHFFLIFVPKIGRIQKLSYIL